MSTKMFKIAMQSVATRTYPKKFNEIVATYGDGDAQVAQITLWKQAGWFFANAKDENVITRAEMDHFHLNTQRPHIVAVEGHVDGKVPDLTGLTSENLIDIIGGFIDTDKQAVDFGYTYNTGTRLEDKEALPKMTKTANGNAEAKAYTANLERFISANMTNMPQLLAFQVAKTAGSEKAFLATWAQANP